MGVSARDEAREKCMEFVERKGKQVDSEDNVRGPYPNRSNLALAYQRADDRHGHGQPKSRAAAQQVADIPEGQLAKDRADEARRQRRQQAEALAGTVPKQLCRAGPKELHGASGEACIELSDPCHAEGRGPESLKAAR